MLLKGAASKYKDWFIIESFPVQTDPPNYECVGYLCSSMLGYCISRFRFAGRNLLYGTIITIMLIPGLAMLVPQFELAVAFKLIDDLPGYCACYCYVYPIAAILYFGSFFRRNKGMIKGLSFGDGFA